MKTFTKWIIRAILLSLISVLFFQTQAQQGNSPLLPVDCVYTIEHDTIISPTEFRFDLYLRDTDASQPFLISLIQAGIYCSTSIIGGGTMTCAVVPGYSDLIDSLQPNNATAAPLDANHFILKMSARSIGIWVTCDHTTTMSTVGLGTRVCRLKVVNTVPFPADSHADLQFCLESAPPAYKAKIFQFENGVHPCYSIEVPTDTSNCYPGPTYQNISLNKPNVGIDVSSNPEIRISSIGKSVFINSTKTLRNTRVTICNLLGQEIATCKIEGQEGSKIQVTAGSGYYIVKVSGDNVFKIARVYLN